MNTSPMNSPAILSPGIEGFGQVSDTAVSTQDASQGKLFQSLLLQKFTALTTGVATAPPALTQVSVPAAGAAQSGNEPPDILKLLSELEAAESDTAAAGSDAATAEPTQEQKATDGNKDSAGGAPPPDPQTTLTLLETLQAVMAGAAPNPAPAVAIAASADSLAGGTAPISSALTDVGSKSSGATTIAEVAAAVIGSASSHPGKTPLQTLHDQFVAQESVAPGAHSESHDNLDSTLQHSDALAQKFTIQSLSVDANGPVLQTTQVSAHSTDSTAATVAPMVERSISVPVGHRGWTDAVGAQVLWMVDQRVQSARLQVTPDGMGPIEVHLSVDNNSVSVNFIAQHAETRDSLEQSLPQLRAMLSGAGLSLGQATVQQQSQHSGQSQFSHDGTKRDADHIEDNASVATLSTGLGLVDEYA